LFKGACVLNLVLGRVGLGVVVRNCCSKLRVFSHSGGLDWGVLIVVRNRVVGLGGLVRRRTGGVLIVVRNSGVALVGLVLRRVGLGRGYKLLCLIVVPNHVFLAGRACALNDYSIEIVFDNILLSF
jgi:hypothetical protein